MNEWLIPDYWLTGLGTWAISYFLHSTVILGGILLLTHFAGFMSQSSKDVLVKVALVAGILTASLQFVQSSNGTFINPIVLNIEPVIHRQAPAIDHEVVKQLLQVGPPLASPEHQAGQLRDNPFQRFWSTHLANISGLQWFLAFWLLGSVLSALRFIYLWQGFSRVVGKRHSLTHQPSLDLCQRLKDNMVIKRPVKFTVSSQIVSPMAIGLSEICIPEDLWSAVDEEQFTAIIAHELAHVARMDSMWLFFWHLMSIVFFFQPLNKLTQLSFQSRAEFLADAIAVHQTKDPIAMVNSLMSAAKLARLASSHAMATHLLGANATIVARTKSLLNEKPQKTQTSLSFIALSAMLIVAVAAFGLPGISLASKQITLANAVAQKLRPDNSVAWQFGSTSASSILPFETTIEHQESIAGLAVEIYISDVTFSEDFDHIGAMGVGGRLHFVSRSIYETTSLLVETDDVGEVRYRYLVDNDWVTDQRAAEQFMQQLLDITMGRNDEFKRNRLKDYTNDRPEPVQTDAYKVITELQIKALRDDSAIFSEQDLKVILLMFRSPNLFNQAEDKWAVEKMQNDSPFAFAVVNSGANSGANSAILNPNGELSIRTTTADGLVQTSTYYLNNKMFYQLFLTASGGNYIHGETEQAMAWLLVRLHFQQPEHELIWLKE